MKTKIYYLGLYKRNNTMVLQAVNSVDELNCEIIEYFGPRETTKKRLTASKQILFAEFKKTYNSLKDCKYITVE